MMSDDDIDRLLSLTDMPHVPYPPTHTEEVVILSKADYDALVANQAAPPAMTEEVAQTIEAELKERRQQVEMAMRQYKAEAYPKSQKDWAIRLKNINAALRWLEAMKEVTNDGQ